MLDPAHLDPYALKSLPVLLERMTAAGASDLHLEAGIPPTLRVDGRMMPVAGAETMSPEDVRGIVYQVLNERQRQRFEEDLELDLSYEVAALGRFRMNVLRQRGAVGAVIRAIPRQIPSLEELGMPPVVATLADRPRGLVLVTGPTGSGKSTTIAALIDRINANRREHIVTIEDPIEYLHAHRQSVVIQREVGEDTRTFAAALRHVLRQDPDVILVGEMRDPETIGIALTAAETGHLVFATLHTSGAKDTVTRVVDSFPRQAQEHVRAQLAESLQAIVSQTLCPRSDGNGRVAAVEVMIATPAIRNQIRSGKVSQTMMTLQGGAAEGMMTLNQHLVQLVRAGVITVETGLNHASDIAEFNDQMRRNGL